MATTRCYVTVCVAYILVVLCEGSLDTYYMDEICGSTNDLAEIHSASVETSISLTYPNNMDCTVSFTAPAGQRFYFQITRFVTEKSGGNCFDSLSIYDGSSSASTAIIDGLCGEVNGEPEYNTTGESITFHFTSDESAKDRGFGVFLLAFNTGSCRSNQILCETMAICIDEATSICDDYDHCGDGTDETSCAEGAGDEGNGLASFIGLIVGLAIAGLVVLILLIVVVYFGYKRYQWNQYMKTLYNSKQLIVKKKLQTSYPLTHHYQDDEYINVTKAQRDAAMVRLDDNPESEVDIPFGSSASLASSAHFEMSTAGEKPVLETSSSQALPQSEPDIQPSTNMVHTDSATEEGNTPSAEEKIDTDEK